MGFLPMEHRLNRRLKNISIRHVLVACSGGVDSMVLVELLRRLQAIHKYKLSVVYIHHGLSKSEKVNHYRESAKAVVKTYCQKYKLHFLTNKTLPNRTLSSEAELRSFRMRSFRSLKKIFPQLSLVTAHHAGDLLETRLLQLIRGSGAQGFVGVHGLDQGAIMPLREFTKEQIQAYAQARSLIWQQDPTNTELKALRNWLRNEWLPSLERRQKGSTHRLSESLDKLHMGSLRDSFNRNEFFTGFVNSKGQIERKAYSFLPRPLKLSFLAWFLRRKAMKAYTQNHIEEASKRLDSSQKEFRFNLLKCQWIVDAQHISVQL